ncbi:MAG: ABC transporter ATP-binding protein [Angelakisella sp.]
MENILEIKNVSKRFGTLMANKNVNMTVKKGTTHAIIGENGAGKSTLMNMIAGVLRPTEGQIYVKGQLVNIKNPNEAGQYGIGMVHQEFMLFSELTVLENIMMGFETKKFGCFLDKQKARKEIEDICQKYNFSIPLDTIVKDLPVSMMQQVEIVKVLYKGADIIILDEPTAVLTPQGIEGLFQAIRFLISKGKTVIIITHKLKEVMEISDYITVLKNGEVTGNVRPQDVNEKILASMMVGREVLLTANKKEKTIGEPLFRVEKLNVNDDDGNHKVKDVSFTVKRGEIVGIAGVAGSGQKELIEALFGLRSIENGTVTFQDKDITSANCRMRRCLGIGYVPQDRLGVGSNKEASAIDNCIMGYHIAHGFSNKYLIGGQEATAFTQKVIDDFKVKISSPHTKVKTLSGGNIQKLVVGREFEQKNDLLIIEDPTRGIDIGAIEFIWQEIINIAAKGVAVLLVSHELTEIMELSDRILVIYDGKLMADRPRTDLDEQKVGLLMLGGNDDE